MPYLMIQLHDYHAFTANVVRLQVKHNFVHVYSFGRYETNDRLCKVTDHSRYLRSMIPLTVD